MRDRSWVFGDRPKRRAPPPEPPRAPTPAATSDEADWIVVEYAPIRCPLCGGKAKHVKRLKSGVRYHQCNEESCGQRFKSIERCSRVVFCPSRMRPLLRRDDRR